MGDSKFDPNREAFQMRAQWKKSDICRKMWTEKWSWLLDERATALAEATAIRREAATALTKVAAEPAPTKTLKPVPVTSTGFVGWLGAKPNCQLEVYTSWLVHIPTRLPDVWDNKSYEGPGT